MSCNKITFDSKADANDYLNVKGNRIGKHQRKLKPLYPYYCEHCSHWHLTSQSKSDQRRYARFQRRLTRGNP